MKVTVVNDPPGVFDSGRNKNSFEHLVGSNIKLTCSISTTPAANSMFKWRCSTGCLEGVKMEQTINVTMQKSGEIFCAYTIDGVGYNSNSIGIYVAGKLGL